MIDNYPAALEAAETRIRHLTREGDTVRNELAEAKATVLRQAGLINELRSRNDNQAATIATDRARLAEQSAKINALKDGMDSFAQANDKLGARLIRQGETIMDDAQEIKALRADIERLSDLRESDVAFRQTVSNAMRLIQKHLMATRHDGQHIDAVRVDGEDIFFSHFIIAKPLVTQAVVTINGKDNNVSLAVLARLIKGGARIEKIAV